MPNPLTNQPLQLCETEFWRKRIDFWPTIRISKLFQTVGKLNCWMYASLKLLYIQHTASGGNSAGERTYKSCIWTRVRLSRQQVCCETLPHAYASFVWVQYSSRPSSRVAHDRHSLKCIWPWFDIQRTWNTSFNHLSIHVDLLYLCWVLTHFVTVTLRPYNVAHKYVRVCVYVAFSHLTLWQWYWMYHCEKSWIPFCHWYNKTVCGTLITFRRGNPSYLS